MIRYSSTPNKFLLSAASEIASFMDDRSKNLDVKTVEAFGEEWSVFNTFSDEEIERLGADYFDLLSGSIASIVALDVGCGSGRWAAYLAKRVKFVEAIDPSVSVFSAQMLLQHYSNARVTQASTDTIPFADNSFDLVYSLGVLHHVPDTLSAIKQCFEKVKSQGYFLLYLYYNLENRGSIYRFLFAITSILRKSISRLAPTPKRIVCDIIAVLVYWPLAKFSKVAALVSESLAEKMPLSYYKKTSFFVMRNDALDRFGTPLEKRFSKSEITQMLQQAGFINIRFSDRKPYWHVIAQKP